MQTGNLKEYSQRTINVIVEYNSRYNDRFISNIIQYFIFF